MGWEDCQKTTGKNGIAEANERENLRMISRSDGPKSATVTLKFESNRMCSANTKRSEHRTSAKNTERHRGKIHAVERLSDNEWQ